ncbi:MAG: lytic transglycosylase domain-containing protein [Butyribacter sp.]|nr:lytic transglycosylase domain-containing protein [bacterium]MDY3853980.1 lytic transglycosylase domain-containing protein [Butyribacter sp.]
MIRNVSYLNIQPLQQYSDGVQRETTITSFEDMLRNNKTSEESESKKTEDSKTEDKDTASNTDSVTNADKEEDVVLFTDPSTGKKVTYEDVASDTAKKVSSATKKSATSVDSMKKTKYDAYFKKAAKRYGVSESLLKAIAKAESNFNAKDVSSAGAIGVMQLMPATAKSLGVDNPYDPEDNIMGGAKCIKQKLKEFNGNVRLALAAYNAGSGAVKRNGGVPSYCKSYVSKVLSYKEAFETASAVG